jgi:hypothetical protein
MEEIRTGPGGVGVFSPFFFGTCSISHFFHQYQSFLFLFFIFFTMSKKSQPLDDGMSLIFKIFKISWMCV